MQRRLLRVLLALALGVGLLALAAPASAVPPDIERFHFEGTQPWTSCDGFDIIINFSVDGLYTAFSDQQGNLVREQIHFQGTGELVNTVTGKTETGSSPTMEIVDSSAAPTPRWAWSSTTTFPVRALSPWRPGGSPST